MKNISDYYAKKVKWQKIKDTGTWVIIIFFCCVAPFAHHLEEEGNLFGTILVCLFVTIGFPAALFSWIKKMDEIEPEDD